jgi:hypothetical protein
MPAISSKLIQAIVEALSRQEGAPVRAIPPTQAVRPGRLPIPPSEGRSSRGPGPEPMDTQTRIESPHGYTGERPESALQVEPTLDAARARKVRSKFKEDGTLKDPEDLASSEEILQRGIINREGAFPERSVFDDVEGSVMPTRSDPIANPSEEDLARRAFDEGVKQGGVPTHGSIEDPGGTEGLQNLFGKEFDDAAAQIKSELVLEGNIIGANARAAAEPLVQAAVKNQNVNTYVQSVFDLWKKTIGPGYKGTKKLPTKTENLDIATGITTGREAPITGMKADPTQEEIVKSGVGAMNENIRRGFAKLSNAAGRARDTKLSTEKRKEAIAEVVAIEGWLTKGGKGEVGREVVAPTARGEKVSNVEDLAFQGQQQGTGSPIGNSLIDALRSIDKPQDVVLPVTPKVVPGGPQPSPLNVLQARARGRVTPQEIQTEMENLGFKGIDPDAAFEKLLEVLK